MVNEMIRQNTCKLCVPIECALKQVLAVIDQNAKGIALVVDDQQHLVATITDGDIRRAMLAGYDLNTKEVIQGVCRSDQPLARPFCQDSIRRLKLSLFRDRIAKNLLSDLQQAEQSVTRLEQKIAELTTGITNTTNELAEKNIAQRPS